MNQSSRMTRHTLIHAIVFLIMTCAMTTQALPGDREQPIKIQSNTAERNEKSGETTYRGQVEMTQGSLRIEADSITILSSHKKVTHIIATGKPARYEQQPEANKAPVKATGNTIKYFVDTEKLHLIEHASINQDGAVMKGERIDYDIRSAVLKAGETNKPTRVEMVIPAATLNRPKEPTAE